MKDTRTAKSLSSVRFFSDDGSEEEDPLTAPREAMPFDVLIVGMTDDAPPDVARTSFDLWYDVKSDDAREAMGRARGALRDLGEARSAERREHLLGGDPGAGLSPLSTDVASEADASGARLGMWLPFVVLLVLISGGAYAALAVFAGEREAGTLETLLVQPVPHRSIAMGKLLTVFVAGCATLAMNLGSLVVCAGSGLMDMGSIGGGASGMAYGRLAALVVELPTCLLLCAVLCLVPVRFLLVSLAMILQGGAGERGGGRGTFTARAPEAVQRAPVRVARYTAP